MPSYDSSHFGIQWTIPFNKPFVFPEGLQAVESACEAGKLSGDGENSRLCVQWFERSFHYNRCLLTPSCTAALEMAALLLDLKEGDEVICPSFTFVSSANAFALRGVDMVFADSQRDNPNVCVDDVISKITDKTKAIVIVHYAGVPVDMSRLVTRGIPIIEDCAHAIGMIEPLTGKHIGTQGCLATFSFHETKNISVGEGGMLVVNDPDLWEKAQIIREKGTNRTQFREGRSSFYTWLSLGGSHLMSEVDAGLLYGALQNFEKIQSKRNDLWMAYDKYILPSSLFRKNIFRANSHMFYLIFAKTEERAEFCKWMKDAGVLVATHYMPLDASPFAQEHYDVETPCLQAQKWSKSLVRLPLYYSLGADELQKVTSRVNEFSSSRGLAYSTVSVHHYEDIRRIRNLNRMSFGNKDEIDAATHKKFMDKHAVNYRVVLNRNLVVGFIGQVENDLRLAVHPSNQQQGIAQFMYPLFLEEYPDVTVKVNRDNDKSLAFFKKVGWHVDPSIDRKDPVPLIRGVISAV